MLTRSPSGNIGTLLEAVMNKQNIRGIIFLFIFFFSLQLKLGKRTAKVSENVNLAFAEGYGNVSPMLVRDIPAW